MRPNAIGGNHTHYRTEIMYGMGDGLKFYYVDKDDNTKSVDLGISENKLTVITVYAKTPHAVVNHSDEDRFLREISNMDDDTSTVNYEVYKHER
jgi:hypothetical protein